MGRATLAVVLLLATGAVAQTPKTAPKQPAAPAKKTTTPAKATAAAKKAPAKKTTAKKTTAKRRVVRPRVQQKPTPERYTEIQQALIGRGFLQGSADGKWGDDSVEALKSFQQSQKLTATGKIDALSLIRLGLGPKTDAGLPPSAVDVKP